jgi:hypothetical protein
MVVEVFFDVLCDNVDGHPVIPPFRHDDVGVSLGWFDKLQVTRTNGIFIPSQDLVHIPSAFDEVALNHPGQPDIRFTIDENLDIHQFPELLWP